MQFSFKIYQYTHILSHLQYDILNISLEPAKDNIKCKMHLTFMEYLHSGYTYTELHH
jgi:hypothetical protein